jgi:putative transposase
LSEAKPIGRPAAVTDCRRNFLPGGSYFFTINLAERRLTLLTERIDVFRAGLASVYD